MVTRAAANYLKISPNYGVQENALCMTRHCKYKGKVPLPQYVYTKKYDLRCSVCEKNHTLYWI